MEEDPGKTPGNEPVTGADDTSPPFDPDPDIVGFLERGAKPDAQKWWRKTDPNAPRH